VKRTGVRVTKVRNRLNAGNSPSPIIPIRGELAKMKSFQEHLLESALWAPLVYPPTVPEGSERIRLSVTLGWEEDWIDRITEAFHREKDLKVG
ncbi:MAG: 8-amino-7-oxononanoate synthase, partial [Nitrospiraceae bacterium]|nr:8-amino-7-oxononanoate synthase [Nitrospiraceae bacterium]